MKAAAAAIVALLTPSLMVAQYSRGRGAAGPVSSSLLSVDKPTGTVQTARGEYVTVPAQQTTTMLNLSGAAGYVTRLWIGLTCSDGNARNGSLLTITADGAPVFADRAVLFFAAEYQLNSPSFLGTLIGANNNNADNVGFYSYIPIPFSTSLSVTLTNASTTTTATLWWTIEYQTGVPDLWPRMHKLRVASGTLPSLPVDTVTTLLNASNVPHGRLLGIYLNIDSYPGNASPAPAPLEGDLKIYIDGANTAAYQSSGTEDYFGASNYFQGFTGGTVSPYIGVTIKSAVTWAAYRFHILDPITFQNALRVTWNCGDSTQVNFSGTARLAYTIWYYTE